MTDSVTAGPNVHGRAARHDEPEHRRAANRAVGVSAIGLATTGGLELLLAVVTGSVALLGDALHNLSDVSTSAVVFIGFRVSRRPPTTRYPYGYERAEDLAGLGVALVIWLSAAFAAFESYLKLLSGNGTSRVGVGIAGAALGIIGNLLVARYKALVGKRIQSVTLLADAKHSWLDALSSLGALVGLVVVAAGHSWGDPIAGFAVTVFILRVGYEVTSEITHHLMDGVDAADIQAARDAALTVPGIQNATVRARWMGRSLLVDVEAQLSPTVTLMIADLIGRQVKAAVHDGVPAARRVRFLPHATPTS